MKRTNNFFEEGPGNNDVYNFNRANPNCKDIREYCSKLLEHHWMYCSDNHFQKDAVENPQQRWWEMYLSWVLFKIGGFQSEPTRKKGPDFCIRLPDQRKLWIEAIAAKVGVGENEVVRPQEMQAMSLPTDKIILRMTSAFNEKVKKIQKYFSDGVIDPSDAVIIAINTGEIRDSDLADLSPPLSVRALLGVGAAAFQVPIYQDDTLPRAGEIKIIFPRQTEVKKNETTMIGTEGLLNFPSISGVITSTRHFVDMKESGEDIKILLNPFAKIHLDKDLFKFGFVIDIGL